MNKQCEKHIKETHDFLIPDYFLNFKCKTGECRSACCIGWPITLSMRDYYYLLGLNCRKNLRKRLDCGLRVLDFPTEEEYARFEPKYDGNCPLMLNDGLCALHAEIGEGILPDVCCLYPRGVRLENGKYECSCANSCEGVIDIFLAKKDTIRFFYQTLTMRIPNLPERKAFFETLGEGVQIRLFLISILQNRNIPLVFRFVELGKVLKNVDIALKNKDQVMLRDILIGAKTTDVTVQTKSVTQEHLSFGLNIARQIIQTIDANSQSVRGYGENALAYFGEENAIERYNYAKKHFEELLPDWEIFFEHVLVNHMFFSQFPFQDRPESLLNEYIALCGVYAILRFLALGCMANQENCQFLVDLTAATFRLIDHTEFDRYIFRILRRLNCTNVEQISNLLAL